MWTLEFNSIPVDPGLEGSDASVHSVIMRGAANAPADDSNLATINHQRTSAVALKGQNVNHHQSIDLI